MLAGSKPLIFRFVSPLRKPLLAQCLHNAGSLLAAASIHPDS